jgi:HAAS
MAGHDMIATQAEVTESAISCYLAELAAQLRGPRAARERVLAEIHDGLSEATHARLVDGLPPETAASNAIVEFGDPSAVARSFAAELATSSARRTIAAFLATGPMVGIWWLLLLHPAPWRASILAMLHAVPALPLIAIAIATAAATFVTTGRLIRWLPETTPGRALTAASSIAGLCLATDITVLGILATHLATGHPHPAALAGIAATASCVRITAAILVLRHTRWLRRGLTPAEAVAARR